MSSLKFAFRTLFKTPFVTIIAIVSLALGIGANAAIFSCFNQMLLESLSVPQPAQLVNLSAPGPKPGSQSCNQAGDCDAVFSYAMFRDLQKVETVFTGIAAHRLFGANLAYQGQTLNGQGLLVSGNYFQVLQVQPALGRLFDPNDDRLVGEAPVVVLSHAYWTPRFAADPGVLNNAMVVNDVEAPLQKDMSDKTLAQFRAKPIVLEPGGLGQSGARGEAKTPLSLLLGVTGFVLLIACANIANLLLARSAARASEMAVRLSLGAGRARLIGQLLTESLLLAFFGGLAGIVVAHWTLGLIMSLLPAQIGQSMNFTISTPALIFAGALTIGTGLLFGLFPALHSTRPDLVSTLKNQAGQPSGARGAARFRLALATTQIALSMMLLAASGFFVKSLLNVSRINLGIKVDNVIAFGLSPELSGYTAERTHVFFERLEEELRATPGVTGVTVALVPLLAGSNWAHTVPVPPFEARPPPP